MEYKRLYRSDKNKVIAGVAGGIAEFFDLDPVIIRILFAVMFFMVGGGLLLYIILWIAVPEKINSYHAASEPYQQAKPETENQEPQTETQKDYKDYKYTRNKGSYVGAVIFITLGLLFLADSFTEIHFGKLWPVILIVIGIVMLTNIKGKKYKN